MTSITLPRATAQQALEALVIAWQQNPHWQITEGMHALRAALAQQAEPVEPVAWRSENANPPGGYVIFQQYPQALADLGKPIQPLYTAPPQRKQAEPVEPVAWECRAGGLKPLTQRQYDAQTVATKRHYTRIAPPQRKLVPLTAQELDGVIERHVGGSEITDDMYTSMEQFARAIENASWEKNHGQA